MKRLILVCLCLLFVYGYTVVPKARYVLMSQEVKIIRYHLQPSSPVLRGGVFIPGICDQPRCTIRKIGICNDLLQTI